MALIKAIAAAAMTAVALTAQVQASAAAEDLAPLLESVRQHYGLPALAAAVSIDGHIVAVGAVGTRVMGMDLPVEKDDVFHIGSDTKAMTATIAGILVERGLINWDSTVGDVLPQIASTANAELAAVTLTQLLSHSSGLPGDDPEIAELYFSPEAAERSPFEARRWLIDEIAAVVPEVPEGPSPFRYSNLGYLVAGAMLEEVSGQPWERLIHDLIFGPLGLKSAGLGPQNRLGRYEAPSGHQLTEDGSFYPMPWGTSSDLPPLLGPAGLAHMSVTDFARWGGWNAQKGTPDPELVSAQTRDMLHRVQVPTPTPEHPLPGTPERGEYALGWGVMTPEWSEVPLLMHNGSNNLNLAKILVDRQRELAIVVVTNSPGAAANTAAEEVQQMLFTCEGIGSFCER